MKQYRSLNKSSYRQNSIENVLEVINKLRKMDSALIITLIIDKTSYSIPGYFIITLINF